MIFLLHWKIDSVMAAEGQKFLFSNFGDTLS